MVVMNPGMMILLKMHAERAAADTPVVCCIFCQK